MGLLEKKRFHVKLLSSWKAAKNKSTNETYNGYTSVKFNPNNAKFLKF